MPNAMLERVRCGHCCTTKPRGDMSPFAGICAHCFNRCYSHCVDCNALLRTYGSEAECYYLSSDAAHSNPLCYQCWWPQHEGTEITRWRPTPLDTSIATYKRIRSKRKYGVEVETSRCNGFAALCLKTKFGCKPDYSISGREFDSPILYGDEGFAEIEALLEFGKEWEWAVNSSCGCHTHYDMRDESDGALYHIAYAYGKTYTFWSHSVSSVRCSNFCCHAPGYDCSSIIQCVDRGKSFSDFCRIMDRYDYVNINAYLTHHTFEVRLLEGTIDAETICNWVTLHARFMDFVSTVSFDDLDHLLVGRPKHVLSALTRIMNDSSLVDWLATRINEYSPGALD